MAVEPTTSTNSTVTCLSCWRAGDGRSVSSPSSRRSGASAVSTTASPSVGRCDSSAAMAAESCAGRSVMVSCPTRQSTRKGPGRQQRRRPWLRGNELPGQRCPCGSRRGGRPLTDILGRTGDDVLGRKGDVSCGPGGSSPAEVSNTRASGYEARSPRPGSTCRYGPS